MVTIGIIAAVLLILLTGIGFRLAETAMTGKRQTLEEARAWRARVRPGAAGGKRSRLRPHLRAPRRQRPSPSRPPAPPRRASPPGPSGPRTPPSLPGWGLTCCRVHLPQLPVLGFSLLPVPHLWRRREGALEARVPGGLRWIPRPG